ncbi:hypothetical protein TNCV_1064141 [Trichonephila clavipes]|nr:hypothetical protein TNCV_1064141 [Trichonephila clavipes]
MLSQIEEKSIPVTLQLCNISGERLITKTSARLRIGSYRGMNIDMVGRRTYGNSDTQLFRYRHKTCSYFDCPAIFAVLQEIWVLLSLTILYVDNIEQTDRTAIRAHGTVWFGQVMNTISSPPS